MLFIVLSLFVCISQYLADFVFFVTKKGWRIANLNTKLK